MAKSSTAFTLHIDPVKVDREHKVLERSQMYGAFNPMVTKLEDLGIDEKQSGDTSFLFGDKAIGYYYSQCCDHVTNKKMPSTTTIPCFYCTETFTTPALGIPIKFVPSFSVEDGIQRKIHTSEDMRRLQEQGRSIVKRDYYEVDGNFCSFPCMMTYISLHPGPYTESLQLMKRLHWKLYGCSFKVEWAPDIRLLKKYGGHMSIQEWRSEEGRKYIKTNNMNRPSFSNQEESSLLVPVSRLYRYHGQK